MTPKLTVAELKRRREVVRDGLYLFLSHPKGYKSSALFAEPGTRGVPLYCRRALRALVDQDVLVVRNARYWLQSSELSYIVRSDVELDKLFVEAEEVEPGTTIADLASTLEVVQQRLDGSSNDPQVAELRSQIANMSTVVVALTSKLDKVLAEQETLVKLILESGMISQISDVHQVSMFQKERMLAATRPKCALQQLPSTG